MFGLQWVSLAGMMKRIAFLLNREKVMRNADRKDPSEGKPPVQAQPDLPDAEAKLSHGGVLSRRAGAMEGRVASSDEGDDREVEAAGRLSRSARKRPCFHCGTMTSVKVLEKTGDLCYRCYRPAGYQIIRTLLLLVFLVLVIGGGVIAWRMYGKFGDGSGTLDAETSKSGTKEFAAEQKINILKRHLLDGVPVATLCRNFGMDPGEYQQWQQLFFQAGERAFEPVVPREAGAVERRIATIEQKIQMAGKVLVELRENVNQLRKESGHYDGTPSQKFILDSVGPPPRNK